MPLLLADVGLHLQLRLRLPLRPSLLCQVLEPRVPLGLPCGRRPVFLQHTLPTQMLQGAAHAHLPLVASCRLRDVQVALALCGWPQALLLALIAATVRQAKRRLGQGRCTRG